MFSVLICSWDMHNKAAGFSFLSLPLWSSLSWMLKNWWSIHPVGCFSCLLHGRNLRVASSWSKFFIDIVILCMIYWIFVCMILVLLSSTIFIFWSVFARLFWWWKDCYESFIHAEGHILGLLKFLSLILIRVPMKVYMELYGPS